MKLPRLSSASRTVLVMLLGIAALELGISHKFGEIWNLAFQTPPQKETAPVLQQSQGTTGQPPAGNQPPTMTL